MNIRKCIWIAAALFFAVAFSFSQEESQSSSSEPAQSTESQNPKAPDNGPHFGFGFQFGAMVVDGVGYNTVRLQPDFAIGKFGVGLDLNFEFDGNGNFRVTEWNSWQAILSKILYIRYGFKGDPIYAKAGGINDFILGNGFIINRYSNMFNYPAFKKIGLAFDLDLMNFGFESMVDNLFDFDIMGLRAYYRPLMPFDIPLFSKLEIGATAAADLDPDNPLPPANQPYNFSDSNTGKTIFAYGVDLGLPIVSLPFYTLRAYAEFAGIAGKGTGELLGVGGKIVTIVPYKLELRILQPKFIPSYFDAFYDAGRSLRYNSLDLIMNGSVGWLFDTGLSLLGDKLIWDFQIEGQFDPGSKPMLTTTFSISRDVLKIIGIQFTWIRKNLSNYYDIFIIEDANSILLVNIDYGLSDNLVINANYKRTFTVDANGQIKPFTSTTISTGVRF
jgi:hypothetical protein